MLKKNSCLQFRWIPVQETLAHSIGWLWCCCCRVMVFTCIPLPLDELYEQMAWSDGEEKKKRHAWQCKLTHHSGACRHGRTVLLVPSIWRGDDPERTQISQNNSGADPARHTDAHRTSTGLQLNLLLSYLINTLQQFTSTSSLSPMCSNLQLSHRISKTSPNPPHI